MAFQSRRSSGARSGRRLAGPADAPLELVGVEVALVAAHPVLADRGLQLAHRAQRRNDHRSVGGQGEDRRAGVLDRPVREDDEVGSAQPRGDRRVGLEGQVEHDPRVVARGGADLVRRARPRRACRRWPARGRRARRRRPCGRARGCSCRPGSCPPTRPGSRRGGCPWPPEPAHGRRRSRSRRGSGRAGSPRPAPRRARGTPRARRPARRRSGRAARRPPRRGAAGAWRAGGASRGARARRRCARSTRPWCGSATSRPASPARNSTMRASTRHGRPVRNVSSGQCRCTTSIGRVKRRR